MGERVCGELFKTMCCRKSTLQTILGDGRLMGTGLSAVHLSTLI